VAHVAIRAIGLLRTPFRIRPRLAVRTPAFREFAGLMLPRMVSQPIDPLMLTYFTNLAASIGVGAVSSFNFASDYQVVPVSLIGVSFSLAVFPTLAAAFVAGDAATFRRVLARNLVTIGGLTVLAALILAVVAHPLVEVLLGGGAFGPGDVDRTATVLTAYALSIPLDSLSYPLSRALYATHNTILQVGASIAGFITIVIVGSALAGPVGIVAIPVAAAAGGVVKIALLSAFLVPRLRRIGTAGPAIVAAETATGGADR
jgi:putative peptidoglycan lipid II flippase